MLRSIARSPDKVDPSKQITRDCGDNKHNKLHQRHVKKKYQELKRWLTRSSKTKLLLGASLSFSIVYLFIRSGSNEAESRTLVKRFPTCVMLSFQEYIPVPTNATLLPFLYNERHKSKLRDDSDELEAGDCRAMGHWQLESHPNCNLLHEVSERSNDYRTTKLLANGAYRETWLINWNGNPYAMKTLVYHDEMSARNLDRHRRDAIAMSMLSSSIHIPNIYAHCSDSGIFDYSPGGDMESIVRSYNKPDRYNIWSHEEMLRYAWQASAALADVHNAGNIYGLPAIAHTDVDPDQILWMDGMFKLNDFNRGRFITWNKKKQEPCPFYISHAPGKFRSPEEYTKGKGLTPKVDVYTLGNVFHFILTKKTVFKEYSEDRAKRLVRNGISPSTFLEKQSANFSAIERSIIKAMKLCQVFDVNERSSASEVEFFLRRKMNRFNVSFF